MPARNPIRSLISVYQASECWTGSGLERFPQVEKTLESLYRRLNRSVKGKKLKGGINTLISYFHRGFIPLSAPNKRERRRGSAIITNVGLRTDIEFLKFLSTLGEWDLLGTET